MDKNTAQSTNPISSIMARLTAIDLQVAKVREMLAPLENERQELANDLKVLKKYIPTEPELRLNLSEGNVEKSQQISVRALIIQEFKDFDFPMTRADVVSRLALKRDGVNESSIASLLSRLVSDGILKKNGPSKYEIA